MVVVDDASADRTLYVASSLDGVEVIRNERRLGRSGSRNRGLEAITTDFVAIQDADDYSLPHRLQETIPLALDGKSVVGTQLVWKDKRKGVYSGARWPDNFADTEALLSTFRTPVAHPSMLLPTELLKSVGGYDQTFPVAEDLDLMLRLRQTHSDLKFTNSRTQSVVYERARLDSAAYVMHANYWRSRVEERHTGGNQIRGSWMIDGSKQYVRQRLRYARDLALRRIVIGDDHHG
ncbi:glycosyltransferase involved in cell wall biosynthesis [Arthrobacter bambusae]|nr:glycosyltransferase involved in cell wall biosynthesis [Arthrobacter bambusae]MDQ0099672.1 glycosyltransferase involved in cell wall biosynthesis [Arthrobacter bambusae]